MSTASTRTEKRAPVTLKIKFKSSTLDQFVERYSVDISQGGIFIRTKSPLEVGTPLRFEFQLKNATPLITGEGTVVWTREYDPSRTGLAPGMGVRFDRLPPDSQQVLSTILEQKKSRPMRASRSPVASDPAEEFVDSPTRVAPRDVIAGLADTSRETFSDHEDVPADAFEEATKVGLLDDLVARTAEPEPEEEPILTSAPRERAPSSQPIGIATASRHDDDDDDDDDDEPELPAPVTFRDPPGFDDVEPVPPDSFDDEIVDLPAPAAARRDSFLDNVPTELNLAPPPPSKSPADHAPTDLALEAPKAGDVEAAKQKLGAPSETLLDSVPPLPDRPPQLGDAARVRRPSPAPLSRPLAATPHLLASDDRTQRTEIEPASGGGSGLWIAMAVGIILLAGGGGAWWLMTQPDEGATAERPATSPDIAKRPTPRVDPSPPEPVAPAGVEATIASPIAGAVATLVGAGQSGPVPMTFKGLEEGKTYKISVKAPGYLPAEVEITAGQPSEPVELEAKPRFIAVTSVPEGAAVYINKRRRGRTPLEIELKGALADEEAYDVQLRRAGYESVSETIDASDRWSEENERMVASLDLTLNKRAPRVRPPRDNDSGDSDTAASKNGGDSASTGGDSGDAKDTGSSDTGADTGETKDTGATGEPVPDWAKDKGKKEGADKAKPPETPATKPEPKPDPTPEPATP